MRAHEDAAGSAVDVDEAFTADGGADKWVERSTVKSRLEDQQTARFPSIFSSSFSSSTSISSSSGTLLSRATAPLPTRLRLKKPSPPEDAEECFLRAVRIWFWFSPSGEEHAVLNRHSGGAPFLDIHKNDVFVGRFQHEISVADVLRFYGRFLCHGAFDGLCKQSPKMP